MEHLDVVVKVPTDRVTEFYHWFAEWYEAGEKSEASPQTDEESLKSATRWWALLKPRERELFSLWIDEAPRMHSAASIIDRLGLDGPREIPGILSWPGRKGKKVDFPVSWSFRYDPVTSEAIYGIEDPEYADLIRRARAAAEEK